MVVYLLTLWLGWQGAQQEADAENKRKAREHFQLASDLFLRAQYSAAAQQLRRSLQLDPRQLRATRLLGICYQLAGNLEEAEAAFLRAVKLQPRDAESWFLLGRVYYVRNVFDDALQALEKARRLDPRNVRLLECLALTLEALGQTDRAVTVYEEAVRWNSAHQAPFSTPHMNFGVLLHKLGRFEESRKQMETSIQINPRDWQAHFELAKLHYTQARLDAAAAALESALAAGTAEAADRARLYRLLAQVCYRLGREEDARKAAAMAERQAP